MVAILRTQAEILGHGIGIGSTTRSSIAPVVEHILLGIQRRLCIRYGLGLCKAIVADADLALLASLGGHKDNAIGATTTVNSGGRSILQHIDALDLRSGNVVDVANGKAIDYEERVVRLSDRTATTHTNRLCSARATIFRNDVHTGQPALQGFSHIGYWGLLHVVTFDRCYSARQVTTSDGTITDHYDLIKQVAVFGKRNSYLRLSCDIDTLCSIADERHLQCGILRHIGNREITIEIGGCAHLGPHDDDIGSRYRLTIGINHSTRHGSVLGKCQHSTERQSHQKH